MNILFPQKVAKDKHHKVPPMTPQEKVDFPFLDFVSTAVGFLLLQIQDLVLNRRELVEEMKWGKPKGGFFRFFGGGAPQKITLRDQLNLAKMGNPASEDVSPIKNGGFPSSYVSLPEGNIPIGSMGLVYVPTWMVDFYGKCREIIPVPWILWALTLEKHTMTMGNISNGRFVFQPTTNHLRSLVVFLFLQADGFYFYSLCLSFLRCLVFLGFNLL